MVVWPTNESKKVSHGYGDSEDMPTVYHATPTDPYDSGGIPVYRNREFHQGVDIPGTASGAGRTQILAVTKGVLRRDGRFEQTFRLTPDAGSGITGLCYYSHVRLASGVTLGNVTEGQYILNLAHITNWVEPAHVCDHLHFQIDPSVNNTTPQTNPLSVLPHDAADHNLKVTIEQFRYVRMSGDTGAVSYISETSPVVTDALILRLGIVTIARGEDVMGYNSWTPGAHKIEYEVKDGPTSSAKINAMKLFEWTGRLPANQHYRVAYNMGPRPCNTTYHFNYYVVTNTDGKDPIDNNDFSQWWNTKAKEAGSAGNGVGADDAGLNSQAFFPDGKYTIKVTGYDIKGGSSSAEKLVILDNFKPYVSRVVVKVGETVKYDASWPETDTGTLEALDRKVDETCGTGKSTFEIFFSETMDENWSDFKVEIQPSDSSNWINVSDNASWSKETFDNDKWTAEVTIPPDAGSGEAKIRIRARDLAGNELDTDPQSIAEFDRSANSWSNYSLGSDENHRIKIEPSKGSLTVKLISKS